MGLRTTDPPPSSRRRSLLIVLASLALVAVAAGLTLSSVLLGRRVGPALGLLETVFSTPDFQGPPLVRGQDSSLDLSFPGLGIAAPERFFSVRWEGFWDVGRNGAVDIYASGDDRVAVFVDEVLVLERSAGMRLAAQSLRLSPGVHRLKVEYVQYGGGTLLTVLWAPAGQSARPFARESLFTREPDLDTLGLARRASLLRRSAALAWPAASLVLAAVLGAFCIRQWRRSDATARMGQMVRRLQQRYGAWTDQYSPAGQVLFAVAVAAVTIRTCVARLSGLNPESLWWDDLAWAVLVRADHMRAMFQAPTHAPPGFLTLLRVSRGLFSDPEWSVQLPAFICGVAAIPMMALAMRRLTRSQGLAVLAAALTALNPLLAHYTVFVKQYSLDFLATSILLLAAASLLDGRDIRPRSVTELALFSGFGLLFSVGSVFLSFPVVGVVVLRVLLARRRGTLVFLLAAGTFALAVIAVFLLFRSRAGELMGYDFRQNILERSYGFTSIWSFVSTTGRRLVESSLPSWKETEPWSPTTVSWTLPFVGLGLIWLFARRSTRPIGWIVLGFMAAFFFTAYVNLYPLTNDRRGIFAFPVFICLAIVGFHLLTEWLPKREGLRLAAGLAVAAFAVYAPIRVQYWDVNDSRLIQRASALTPADGLILSPAGAYLAAYYGPWPVVIGTQEARQFEGGVGIVRGLTVVSATKPSVENFLGRTHPAHLWYVAFRTGGKDENEILQALDERGYKVERVEVSSRGRLYLGVVR